MLLFHKEAIKRHILHPFCFKNFYKHYMGHLGSQKPLISSESHRKNFLTSPAEDSSGGMRIINVFIGVMIHH